MRKKPPQNGIEAPSPRALSARLRALRNINGRKNKIQDIVEALTSSGCNSLDDQARALGLHRATVWTIRKNRHKLGRLSAKTIERIIANPATPPLVLDAVQQYLVEKFGSSEEYADIQREQISIRADSEN
jgi:hypothetical protein